MRARGDRHFSPIQLPEHQDEAMQEQHSTTGSTATPADPGSGDAPPLVGSKLERIAKAEHEWSQHEADQYGSRSVHTWVNSARERKAIQEYKGLFRLTERQGNVDVECVLYGYYNCDPQKLHLTRNFFSLQYHLKKVAELTNQRNQLKNNVYSAVVRTSKAACRAFASEFHQTLPSELRNMVYQYSWDDDALDADSKKEMSTLPQKLRDTPWDCKCSHTHCLCFQAPDDEKRNIFVYPCFVGRNVAREAAAAYYRDMPADRFDQRLIHLKNFLAVDHFHLAVKPLDYIRRLDINIPSGSLNGWNEHRPKRWTKAFDTLHHLKLKKGFRLNVTISGDVPGGETETILQGFRSIYSSLKAAGAIITVTHKPQVGLSIDATNYYKMDVAAWRIYYKRAKEADRWPLDTSSESSDSDSSESSEQDSSSDPDSSE